METWEHSAQENIFSKATAISLHGYRPILRYTYLILLKLIPSAVDLCLEFSLVESLLNGINLGDTPHAISNRWVSI
jgi:hypothetical protein